MQHVVCHLVGRDSSAVKFWQSLNRVYFSFISLAEPLTSEKRGRRITDIQNSVHFSSLHFILFVSFRFYSFVD